MVEPFCSIYTKSYRPYDREPEDEKLRPCPYYNLKENFLPLEDSKVIYNPERDEAVLKDLYLKRLATIYQLSYCSTEGKKSMVIDPNNLDADQFMVYFNNYYAKRTEPVPRPLDTAQRINGCCRFDHYYTGKSTYQEEISYEAYKYFKKDFDAGKSRLFYKKQKEMQKAKGEESQKEESPKEEGSKEEEEPVGKPEKEKIKEKICAICCEKFGDFSCGIPCCQQPQSAEAEEESSSKLEKNS